MDIVDLEDSIQIPYYGPKNMRPLNVYMPFKDLNVGDFMLLRPHGLDLVLLSMGRAEGDVIKDEENTYFKLVKVQCGFLWRNDQMCMNDIYMKIVGMASGNAI